MGAVAARDRGGLERAERRGVLRSRRSSSSAEAARPKLDRRDRLVDLSRPVAGGHRRRAESVASPRPLWLHEGT
jgi:hypothetical protein